jgi:hypothetical protein
MAGFWSQRYRKGADDAQLLVAERIHELRQLPFSDLESRAGVEDVTGTEGAGYQRVTSVKRGPGDELRTLVQVRKPAWFGRLNPLAEEMVLATPGGEMVGEYTLASEGNDARRYDWRNR